MLDMEKALQGSLPQCVVSLPVLINAFFAYLPLLDNLPGFTCSICGQYPMAIIGDGTGYSVFSRHLQDQQSFGEPTSGTPANTHAVRLVELITAIVDATLITHCQYHHPCAASAYA